MRLCLFITFVAKTKGDLYRVGKVLVVMKSGAERVIAYGLRNCGKGDDPRGTEPRRVQKRPDKYLNFLLSSWFFFLHKRIQCWLLLGAKHFGGWSLVLLWGFGLGCPYGKSWSSKGTYFYCPVPRSAPEGSWSVLP